MKETTRHASDTYLARCYAALTSWGAPLDGWTCTQVIDYGEDDTGTTTCELCGCTQVRFAHVMTHPAYFDPVEVGCVCAGVMEGDLLAAKQRERQARNRARRRATFLKQHWRTLRNGNQMLDYKGHTLFINHTTNGYYNTRVGRRTVWQRKGKPLTSPLAAAYAAFDLIDPTED